MYLLSEILYMIDDYNIELETNYIFHFFQF